jgi:hypothetical protein
MRMALEVIGAGFGRTGTLTLKTALEMLGFGPCHHMVEVIEHPEQLPFWNKATRGEAVDWEDVYGPYKATVDWPGCHFYAALADHYPNAKVILSKRDPGRWYESMSETILKTLDVFMGDDHPMVFVSRLISKTTFNTDFSRENVIAAFERHNAEVQRRIPADRLLVFEAAQGWAPLCAFLGVPVPDEPFPRVNDRQEFQTHAQRANEMHQPAAREV